MGKRKLKRTPGPKIRNYMVNVAGDLQVGDVNLSPLIPVANALKQAFQLIDRVDLPWVVELPCYMTAIIDQMPRSVREELVLVDPWWGPYFERCDAEKVEFDQLVTTFPDVSLLLPERPNG
jgi:hypothetical protein